MVDQIKVTFLGFAIDDLELGQILASDSISPVQTHRFGWALIDSMKQAGVDVSLVSTMPVGTYPRNPRRFFRTVSDTCQGLTRLQIGFVNVHILKHVTRLGNLVWKATPILWNFPPDVIVIHGVHSPYLLFGLLMKTMRPLRVVVVLTDPVGMRSEGEPRLFSWIRKFDAQVVRGIIRFFDGSIALTESLAAEYLPNKPSMTIEGIWSGGVEQIVPTSSRSVYHVIYAGGLSSEYGISELVGAFVDSLDSTYVLELYGTGQLLQSLVDRQARGEFVNVLVHGLVSPDDARKAVRSADLTVNPRDPAERFTRYSFPSKIIESMALGTLVLSTKLEGIPRSYESLILFADGASSSQIADAIRVARSMSGEAVDEIRNRASSHVKDALGSAPVGKRIQNFLSGLINSNRSS